MQIGELVADFLKKSAPPGIAIEVEIHPGIGRAVRTGPDSPVVKAFAKAYEDVFQKPISYVLSGGSIPIVDELRKTSKSEVILLGLGLPDDMIHAPNEHFGVDRIEKGALIIARALEVLGE
jgi:acetylornithine deacetylase/succinyl-diaminopimelate desuccinylase-like protein